MRYEADVEDFVWMPIQFNCLLVRKSNQPCSVSQAPAPWLHRTSGRLSGRRRWTQRSQTGVDCAWAPPADQMEYFAAEGSCHLMDSLGVREVHLNGREAHLRFVSTAQSYQVLHEVHELVWIFSLIHWSHLCIMQHMVDCEPSQAGILRFLLNSWKSWGIFERSSESTLEISPRTNSHIKWLHSRLQNSVSQSACLEVAVSGWWPYCTAYCCLF